jgi:hypothetical protein
MNKKRNKRQLSLHANAQKRYRQRHPKRVYEINKSWNGKNKDKCLEYGNNWRKKHPEYYMQYREKNRKKLSLEQRQYRKLGKLKEIDAKHHAKRKKLGWNKLFENPFDDIEKIDWHHIDNNNVVALPKELHLLYYGKNHRENTKTIVEQIYGVDINETTN